MAHESETPCVHGSQTAAGSFEEVCSLLRPHPLDGGRFLAGAASVTWGVPYGGLLVAQALAAAAASVPAGLWVRSLHAYFVDAGVASEGVEIDVVPLRVGRSTSWRSVRVLQAGRLLLTAELTFAKDVSSPSHQSPMPEVLPPEELSNVGPALAGFNDAHAYWNEDSAFDCDM
ncbi:acyl-CoA thioesterase [Microbacterium sp. A93]|uniref:acyl-CoA thioesterase n=1 Tax=Microbacterium sp. A93 TaxID=3450716 RepID=UPI003F435BD5